MSKLLQTMTTGLVFAIAASAAALAQAPAVSVLYSFAGSPNDGSSPVAPLLADGSGNLYGTTAYGGNTACSYGCGTVFKLDSTGKETVLHEFAGTDGAYPAGGLVMDASGNLYGTTVSGGSGGLCKNFGCGTVYKIDAAGNFSVLYAFSESTDGGNPTAGLLLDSSNQLYGTTGWGGMYGTGTVFMMDTSGNNRVILHSFQTSDGTEPSAPLIIDSAGNLYSTTFTNGPGGVGTVFKLNIATGNFTVLHAFSLSTEGGYPTAPVVMDAAGNLYGTTAGTGSGGSYGVLFSIDKAGNFSVLHAFAGSLEGGYTATEGRPAASLILDASGDLYGTTPIGGVPVSQTSVAGTAFTFAAGTLTTQHTFYCTFTGCPEGAYPYAGLVKNAAGTFYGTTTSGGTGGGGTVFSLTVLAAPTITNILPTTAVAGGPSFPLTVNGTNFVSGATVNFNGGAVATTFVSSTELTATITASDIAVAGSYDVTVSNPGNEISNAVTFTVTGQATQTITFAPLPTRTLGTKPFSLTATASSGLPVTFASLTTAVCTVLGNTVTLVSSGTCTIEATQPGNLTWSPATPVDQSFRVMEARQRIDFPKPPDQNLASGSLTLSATATSGLLVSFASLTPAVCTVLGNVVTFVSAGTCTIEATQPGNNIYGPANPVDRSFQVSKIATSMTLTSTPGPFVTGVPITFTATVTSAVGAPPDGESVTFRSAKAQLCTAQLSSGVAHCRTSALPRGMNQVTAVYAGDARFLGSRATIPIQLVPAPLLQVGASAAVGVSPGIGFPPIYPPLIWVVVIHNPGPGPAYDVRLASATINGYPGNPSPSANVGTLAQGATAIINLTSGGMLNYGENIEEDTVTWLGGKSTFTMQYLGEAGP